MFYSWHYSKMESGTAYFPFTLPGVNCSTCGAVWAQPTQIAVACPTSLRAELVSLDRRPIDQRRHADLVSRLARSSNLPKAQFRPGNSLMPAFLAGVEPGVQVQVLSPFTLVFSDELKNRFTAGGVRGIAFFKPWLVDVEPGESFGKRLQSSITEAVSTETDPIRKDFWVVAVVPASRLGLRWEVVEHCEDCDYTKYAPYDPRQIPEVMRNSDVSKFPNIKGLILNEKVKQILCDAGVDEAKMQPLPLP